MGCGMFLGGGSAFNFTGSLIALSQCGGSAIKKGLIAVAFFYLRHQLGCRIYSRMRASLRSSGASTVSSMVVPLKRPTQSNSVLTTSERSLV